MQKSSEACSRCLTLLLVEFWVLAFATPTHNLQLVEHHGRSNYDEPAPTASTSLRGLRLGDSTQSP